MTDKYKHIFPDPEEDTQPILPHKTFDEKRKRQTPPPAWLISSASERPPARRRRRRPTILIITVLALLAGVLLVDTYLKDTSQRILANLKPAGCSVYHSQDRAIDMSVSVIIHGQRRHDVFVDIVPPRGSRALPVQNQYHKTFIDTKEPYIQQFYPWDTEWKSGTYTVTYILNGKQKIAESIRLSGDGDHKVWVECN